MQSRLLRWGFLSRCATATAVAAVFPGCDNTPEEQGAELRSGEFDDGNGGGGPQASSIADSIDGGVNINCPECGSHWTVEGGIPAIYLVSELGDGILSVATSGTLRFSGKLGSFTEDDIRQDEENDKGYIIEIHTFSSYEPGASEKPIDLGTGVVRLQHEATPVFVHLPYVDNKTKLFADPPVFE